MAKKPITIFGNGYQIRDLLNVKDLIQAYQLAIDNIGKIKGEVFNIGGGIKNAYSLLEVIDYLAEYLKIKTKIKFKKQRQGDQKSFVSSNKKINHLLGWQVKTDFKTGLKNMINWQKEFFKK